jgi:hypothetical protein
VAVFAPVEVGFPTTVTEQVPLVAARSVPPQVSVRIVKFVASEIIGAEHPVAAAPPVFESVNVWAVEFAPTFTPPKSWVSGLQARLGEIPVTVI